MQIPSLRDVFDNLFLEADDKTVDQAKGDFVKILNDVTGKCGIEYRDSEDIYTACISCGVEERYFGFLQGFSWAVQLLTGKTPNLERGKE